MMSTEDALLTEIQLPDKRREVIMFVRSWDDFIGELLHILNDHRVSLLRPTAYDRGLRRYISG